MQILITFFFVNRGGGTAGSGKEKKARRLKSALQ